MNKVIMFGKYSGNRISLIKRKIKLGQLFLYSSFGKVRTCKFIKVTRKGFNFLDIETNQCILKKRHVYALNMAGKEHPTNIKEVTVYVPEFLILKKIEKSSNAG